MEQDIVLIQETTRRVLRLSKLFSLRLRRENAYKLVSKRRISRGLYDCVMQLWPILDEIYPDRSDMQFELTPKFITHVNTYGSNHADPYFTIFDKLVIEKVAILIHFPEFEITNSEHDKATIRDLFVKFCISKDGSYIYVSSPVGTRTTVTSTEYISLYRHSHLSGVDLSKNDRLSFTDFCLGDGGLHMARNLISGEPCIDPDLFRLFLLQLDSYVRWESLEGGPYRAMANVTNKEYIGNISNTSRIGVLGSLYRLIHEKEIILDLDWRYINISGRYEIINNNKFELLFDKLLELAPILDKYYYYRDESGRHYRTREMTTISSLPDFSKDYISFRNRKIFFNVLNIQPPPEQITRKKYIHPQIKEYVKSKFEELACKYKTQTIVIKKLSERSST